MTKMKRSEEVMDELLHKLHEGEYKKETMPENSPKNDLEMDDAVISSQMASYTCLLQSGLIDAALGNWN